MALKNFDPCVRIQRLLVNACIREKLRKEWNFCKLDTERMIYQDFNFRYNNNIFLL